MTWCAATWVLDGVTFDAYVRGRAESARSLLETMGSGLQRLPSTYTTVPLWPRTNVYGDGPVADDFVPVPAADYERVLAEQGLAASVEVVEPGTTRPSAGTVIRLGDRPREVGTASLTYRNDGPEPVWVIAWFGNRSRVEPDTQTSYLDDSCDLEEPLRVETVDGEVLGYVSVPCDGSAVTTSDLDAVSPSRPSGTITGRALLSLGPDGTVERLRFGGVRFVGPVTRTLSVTQRTQRFRIDLPPGSYVVTVGNSDHLDCVDREIEVVADETVDIDLTCR